MTAQEPWAFVRAVTFRLDVKYNIHAGPFQQSFTLSFETANSPALLEIYAICPALPKFLRHEGIPLDLLRFALGPQNIRAGQDHNVSYPEAITKRVFNSGFVYERSYGDYAFTQGAGRTFELNKFLRIWSVLNGTASDRLKRSFRHRYEKRKPRVKCIDQTGILGLCMSFACKDLADRETLIAYFMAPFGFLHGTPLVGYADQGSCNNPKSRFTEKVWVDNDSESRTMFGKHVFLLFRDDVYDACAGPVFGGPLHKYIQSAIDTAPNMFPKKTLVYDKGTGKNVLETVDIDAVSGKWYNARPYPTYDDHDDKDDGVYGRLDAMMHDGKWWLLPTRPQPFTEKDEWNLDVSKLKEWLQTYEMSDGLKIKAVEEPFTDTGAGTVTHDPVQHGQVTWTIESNDDEQIILEYLVCSTPDIAAAERYGMYGHGKHYSGPSQQQLTHSLVVSETVDDVAFATALAGRTLIHAHSATVDAGELEHLVESIYHYSLGNATAELRVGNRTAIEKSDTHGVQIIQTRVGQRCTYAVQVGHTQRRQVSG